LKDLFLKAEITGKKKDKALDFKGFGYG